MTDKELLELAAKAYGIELGLCPDGNSGFWEFEWTGARWTLYVNVHHPTIKTPKHCGKEFNVAYTNDGWCWEWSPLTDDGDALRLAVALEFRIATHCNQNQVCVEDIYGRCQAQILDFGNDKYAATRRAIVMTAAEIAKAKEE